ncbi:MAG: glycoside hydrolase family 15 protein [Luteitalea sp.]|nr:glycoside hydrolase family 15 protein [Luteitalea sp.]
MQTIHHASAFKPIEDYGIIGNMRTVALVGRDGSIDWLCWPFFDSPSVCAALLDSRRGGFFRIYADNDSVTKQFYWPDTNVLITRFLSPQGVGEVVDFMPVSIDEGHPYGRAIIRRVCCTRGEIRFRLECRLAFDYAREAPDCALVPHGAQFHGRTLTLGLTSSVPLARDGSGVTAEFVLREGEGHALVLYELRDDAPLLPSLGQGEVESLFRDTVHYWRRWLDRCTYAGRWRETVYRSALALKLLTFEPTGALIAAPTCSLPEHIGGERNWDYRYVWIRDAAFTLYALMRIGFTSEAVDFMGWIEARCHEAKDVGLQTMYAIDGRPELSELTLDHLEGYRGSRPVRVGNGAAEQLQLDIYGELLDSVYLFNKYGRPISTDLWRAISRLVNWVVENWTEDDESIWEVRGGQKPFVYSKLMCWVALDRAVRLADKRSFPSDRGLWLTERDKIFVEIMERGWSQDRNAFVQHYGAGHLDASVLLMPLVFFVSPSDPRMLRTIDAIMQPLREGGLMSGGAIYRYDPQTNVDGLPGVEGSFNMCTFWLVEALTRAGQFDSQRLDEARLLFEQMLGYANHLGLYAEQTGPSGEALGNFPQAFTHLALISAAFNLDRALGRRNPRVE